MPLDFMAEVALQLHRTLVVSLLYFVSSSKARDDSWYVASLLNPTLRPEIASDELKLVMAGTLSNHMTVR